MNRESVVADDVAKQITEKTKVLADSIQRELDKTIPWSTAQTSIYRVPEKLRRINSFAYKPHWFSIGPFHQAASNYFKVQKLRYARELLSRNTPIAGTTNMLQDCVACVKRIEDEVRKCYSEPIKLSSDEFVELMVIDGLFIIELFRKYAHVGKIERDDPIFGESWGLRNSVRNLLLLENQLPMVVFDCLFNVLALKKEFDGVSLNVIALQFFDQLIPRGEKFIHTSFSSCQGKHLLDLLGKTFFHNLPLKVGNEKKNSWKSIPSVTKLKRAGVKFAVCSTDGSFLDIKFKDGVMEIPPVAIRHDNDTLLRNLIAYEQCCDGDVTYYMTAYGFLIDSLINSGKDVGILRKHGIITNLESDHEDLCSEVPVANFYYSELWDEVNTYCETRCYGCGAAQLLCSLFS
ncbi:hypothetical protein MKX03_015836 [Papaver bracteatum]|nr:hypothetical protein MKX03_015836 [Papaver bracteatum]